MQILLFSCCFSISAILSARPLSYTISPVWNATEQMIALRVELAFAGDEDGATELELPGQFAGTFHLNSCVSRLRCLGASSLMVRSDSLMATALHAPGANLRLIYEVQQTGKHGFIADAAAPFLPLISENAFHLIGAALFIIPASADGYTVNIKWTDFPGNWLIQNSFNANERQQSWVSPDTRWLSSVFTGGLGWRNYETVVHGHSLEVIMRGKEWRFSDTALVNLLAEVMACQEDFWKDTDRPGFTVVLLPLRNKKPDIIDYSGAALENALVAYADPALVNSTEDMVHFFHHELTHHWIGGKIRNGGPANDMTHAWFSEGFTEYFALLNQLQCGFIDSTMYAKIASQEFIQALEQSPVKHASNDQIAKGFFTDPALRRLPYLRGFVFARDLDGLIEKHSKGKRHLREVMLDLMTEYDKEGYTLEGHFDEVMKRFSKEAGVKKIVVSD